MLAIDDPMLPILRLCGSCLQAHNITSSLSLRNGKADELLASEDLRDHAGLEFLATKVEDWWKADDLASEKA
jgi:hypothetical protein